MGRSRGGLTTKIHLLVDALGRPLRLLLSAGQVHDINYAHALLEGIKTKAVVADKGYDANHLRAVIRKRRWRVVIPSTRSRKRKIRYDRKIYRERNLVERCFNKLKHFRRIATRFDRLDVHYMASLHLASAIFWMR